MFHAVCGYVSQLVFTAKTGSVTGSGCIVESRERVFYGWDSGSSLDARRVESGASTLRGEGWRGQGR